MTILMIALKLLLAVPVFFIVGICRLWNMPGLADELADWWLQL